MDKGNRELPDGITSKLISPLRWLFARRRRWIPILSVMFVIILLIILLNVMIYSPNYTLIESKLNISEQRWNEQNIDSYEYTLKKGSGWHTWEVTIQVRDDFTVSETITKGWQGTGTSREPDFSTYNTIPKLFDRIRDALEDKADVIRVTYNSTLGYPTDVYVKPSLTAMDDHYFFGVLDFHIIESGESPDSSH